MKESVLHYAWETRSFHSSSLTTLQGDPVEIHSAGIYNRDQGPDFHDAHITISGIKFHGAIEIHVNGNEWYSHGHHEDPNYNSVVLHVVQKASSKVPLRCDGTVIPEIILEGEIFPEILNKVDALIFSGEKIPCISMLHMIPDSTMRNHLQTLALLRVNARADKLSMRLKECGHNWEQVIWEELASRMAGPVNKNSFREIAKNIPVYTLYRHKNQPETIEALMMGSAGLLAGINKGDEYTLRLAKDWEFYSAKYSIQPVIQILKQHRMRPASFPILRLSQTAQLFHLFSPLSQLLIKSGWERWLRNRMEAAEYWGSHSNFGAECPKRKVIAGKEIRQNVAINALGPLIWLYHRLQGKTTADAMLVEFLRGIPPENNRFTRLLEQAEIIPANGLESQGMIELVREWCTHKKCLTCAIGKQILKG